LEGRNRKEQEAFTRFKQCPRVMKLQLNRLSP
jgi:hypothetical protein